jgi:hypothetical protein
VYLQIKNPGNALKVILTGLTILFSSVSSAAPVATVPFPTPGQQKGIDFTAYGQGRLLCRDYLQARRQAEIGQYLQLNYYRHWMAGYMTGYNRYLLKGVGSVVDKGAEQTIEQGLEDYCTKQPEDTFALAATAVIRALQMH